METDKFKIIVLNQDHTLVDICTIQRGVKLLLQNKATLSDFYNKENMVIRTTNQSYKITNVIVLKKYVQRTIRNYKGNKIEIRGLNPSRKNVFLRDKYVCVYCQKKYPKFELTLDHVIPKSRIDVLEKEKVEVNSWKNLATCCKKCNSSKDDKTDVEFLGKRLNLKPLNINDIFHDFDEKALEEYQTKRKPQ